MVKTLMDDSSNKSFPDTIDGFGLVCMTCQMTIILENLI